MWENGERVDPDKMAEDVSEKRELRKAAHCQDAAKDEFAAGMRR